MEWPREKRYERLENLPKEKYNELKEKVENSPYRQKFHVQPDTGLLNDPNGFSYFNEKYHLFYQWFPLGPVHGVKYWYHLSSTDLGDIPNERDSNKTSCVFLIFWQADKSMSKAPRASRLLIIFVNLIFLLYKKRLGFVQDKRVNN